MITCYSYTCYSYTFAYFNTKLKNLHMWYIFMHIHKSSSGLPCSYIFVPGLKPDQVNPLIQVKWVTFFWVMRITGSSKQNWVNLNFISKWHLHARVV